MITFNGFNKYITVHHKVTLTVGMYVHMYNTINTVCVQYTQYAGTYPNFLYNSMEKYTHLIIQYVY